MLDADAFQTNGNKIKVYDFVTSGTTIKHIDDYVIAPKSDDPEYHWPFGSGTKHQWTAGTHKFFGWLLEDANMTSTADAAANTPEEFFGAGFDLNENSHVLTIPAKAMTATTPQFDFMYSDVHTRDMDNNPDYKAVPLKFSHLFSAVSFGVANGADETIQVNSVSIKLYTSRSAYIDFSGTSAACAYNTDLDNLAVFVSNSTNSEIEAGDTKENAFDFSKKDRSYYLLWPLFNSDVVNDDEIVDNCTITIEYSYDSNGDASDGYENRQQRTLSFPDVDLEPGNRYHFTLGLPSQTNLDVTLKCEVCPWETASTDIEFN